MLTGFVGQIIRIEDGFGGCGCSSVVEGRQRYIFTVCRVLGSVASGAGEQRTERFHSWFWFGA